MRSTSSTESRHRADRKGLLSWPIRAHPPSTKAIVGGLTLILVWMVMFGVKLVGYRSLFRNSFISLNTWGWFEMKL